MGGSSSTTHTEGSKLAGMSIQSSALGAVLPIGWGRGRISCNLIDYLNWKAIPHTTTTTTQSGKGGSSSTTSDTTYTYSASIILGLCEGPIIGVRTVYKDAATFDAPNALLNAGFSLALGDYLQTPWPYLTSLFPSHALAYRGIAYAYAKNYDLGTTGGVGNHSFEVDFAIQLGGGIADADPTAIITDFLTNANYGVSGWIPGLIGDWSDYSLYCRASNLLFSPVLDGQTAASDFITTLMDMSHSDCFFSEGLLKIKSFGDASATGNGVTWTPDLTPEFDLSEDDFLDEVVLEIADQSDAYNQVSCEYLDRANEYAPAVVPAQDLDNILTYGARKQDVQQWHFICDAAVARAAIQLWLQRVLYVRDRYHFDLPMDYIGLEPMDLVTLTTTVDGMKLNRQLVRIESIDEDEDGADVLHLVAEGLPFTAGAALYASTSGDGFRPGLNDDPGNVQTPILFNAPTSLSDTGYEAWAAVCGVNAAWGGAYVWASFDGTNYSKVGTVMAPARYGSVYSAPYPSGADPDTADTLNVDISISGGSLGVFSSAQADVGASMCLVDNELIAYSNAALAGANQYALDTYVRRGQRGSIIASHAIGAPFVRLDEAIFRLAYPPENAGQTVHIKFQSFNVYGRQVQDLAGVTDYTLALTLNAALPAKVTGLALAGTGGTTWTGNALNIVCDAAARATGYVFNIYKADGVTLVRSIVTSSPSCSYTAAQAAGDTAQREYQIQAYATNTAGFGPPSSMIDATDAAPAAVLLPAASGGTTEAVISCTPSGATDLAGYAVFYSATSGFDPASVGNVVRSGINTVTIGGLAAGTYYCRIAAYDGWTSDPRQLNLSTEMSFTITAGGGSTPTGGGGGGTGGGGTGGGGFSGGRVQNY